MQYPHGFRGLWMPCCVKVVNIDEGDTLLPLSGGNVAWWGRGQFNDVTTSNLYVQY